MSSDKQQLFYPQSEAEMEALGGQLAQSYTSGVVMLYGDLGAGKTTLVRGWLRQLGYTGTVKSPTYTLVEAYALQERDIYHFDLYRLVDPEELEYIGIRDYLTQGSLCLVEWPERAAGLLGCPILEIHVHYAQSGREVKINYYI